MAAEIHVGDVGTEFTFPVVDEEGAAVSLAAATVMEVWFGKPDETVLVVSASRVGDGTGGVMRYVSQAGDLDLDGNWKAQGYVEVGGNVLHTNISKFKVYANLK
jgi:hypothetical protein